LGCYAQVPRYRDIAIPTVILSGDADDTVSPHLHARAVAAAFPDAKLVILPGIGHMPHHVTADEVIAAIDSILAARPAPRAQPLER
jgi:pimeloyl-ACP methyl ester carboxylesterase